MAAATHYDAIIIGAGQGGSPLSTALARAGRRTALIERDQVGGTCINYGCTPTKTMVASARVAWLARRGADYGVQTGRSRSISRSSGSASGRSSSPSAPVARNGSNRPEGLDLIRGSATFTGPRSLRVACDGDSEQELTADLIFIDTGTRNATPKIDGLADVPHLDSTSIMELDETPEHLIVLGGGYIGLEFAQMFRRFGSAVTVIQRGSHLLAREDDDIADAMRQILEEDGIDVRLNAEASRVRKANGGIEVTVNRDGEQAISGSHLLVAIGRAPNTDDLNLAAAGVETNEKGFVNVNERLETNVPGIYALGDVNGGPQFTHISYDDFRVVRDNLLEGGNRTTHDRQVPYCVFTDPELGRVGLTEQAGPRARVRRSASRRCR